MDLQLDGKVAVITGSSRGLGLASARSLVAEGARVCISARGAERLGASSQASSPTSSTARCLILKP